MTFRSAKNNLEKLRRDRGLNQERLAQPLKVSRQTTISLEKRKYHPSIMLAFKITKFFGKTNKEIFYEERDNIIPNHRYYVN
ncbi:MAG: helix-turn-helix transcriptional regulator [Oscillospiraceae bacterium]